MSSKNGHKPGFRPPERTALLVFTESEWEGAEVVVRLNVPTELYFEMARKAGVLEGASDGLAVMPEVEAFLADFSRQILRNWNILDEADEPIPVHPNGLAKIDLPFSMAIITKWMEVAAASPLALKSSGSSTSTASGGARRRAKSSTRTRG